MKNKGKYKSVEEKFYFFKYCEGCDKKFKPFGANVTLCDKCWNKRNKVNKNKHKHKHKHKKIKWSEDFFKRQRILERLKKNGIPK